MLPAIDALAWSLDPATLMLDAGTPGDPWQVDFLRSESKRVLICAGRQCGKTQAVASKATQVALCRADSLVLLFSPTQRQSNLLFNRVVRVYDALGRPMPATRDTATSLRLANGSEIVSLPGSEATVRGFASASLVLLDEASRIDDSLYYAASPMLAVSGGNLVMLSTPFGQRGCFYEQWQNGGPEWERIRVRSSECPRISAEFLAGERRDLGPRWYAQEHECSFESTLDQVFSTESVLAAFDDPEARPLFDPASAGAWPGSEPESDAGISPLFGIN